MKNLIALTAVVLLTACGPASDPKKPDLKKMKELTKKSKDLAHEMKEAMGPELMEKAKAQREKILQQRSEESDKNV